MHYVGSTAIDTPLVQAWAALVDPHQMSACMPGLVQWHVVEENKIFHLTVSWGKAGSPQITIPLRIIWEALHPPQSMVVVGETAVNQLPIFIRSTITLTPQTPHSTTLAFGAVVTTPNPMMDRMVHTAVPPLIAKFFKCLKHNLENS